MSWALGKGMVRADFLEGEMIIREILQGKEIKGNGMRRGWEKSGELSRREQGFPIFRWGDRLREPRSLEQWYRRTSL